MFFALKYFEDGNRVERKKSKIFSYIQKVRGGVERDQMMVCEWNEDDEDKMVLIYKSGECKPSIKIIFFQMDNYVPKKQGHCYKLELGNNDGPFLPRDIMASNPRSIALLNGIAIMNTMATMNTTLIGMKENIPRSYSDNLYARAQKIKVSLSLTQSDYLLSVQSAKQLSFQVKAAHQDYAKFNQKIIKQTHLVLEDSLPLLDNFYHLIKQQNKINRQINRRFIQQLTQIHQSKILIVEGILECEKKIISLEHLFGISSQPQ